MRIINLRLEDKIFNKMEHDKLRRAIPNWELYFETMFKKALKAPWLRPINLNFTGGETNG